MFTGIIQGQGEITSLRKNGTECRLAIRPLFTLTDVIDGESIAVNGACLSVESHSREGFTAYASAETLARTTLGTLRNGDPVNLERALALGDRLGGHLVSGHVDCLATVREVRPSGQSVCCRLEFPAMIAARIFWRSISFPTRRSAPPCACGGPARASIWKRTSSANMCAACWAPGQGCPARMPEATRQRERARASAGSCCCATDSYKKSLTTL